jgi:hypothetical protein
MKKNLWFVLVVWVLLGACTPQAAISATALPTATITTVPTIAATATPQPTATQTATPQPTATATPEPTPTEVVEMTEQEQIRAEVLAAGINLDDLKSSTNSYVSKHPSVETFQLEMDTGFENVDNINKLMVVIGIDQIDSKHDLQTAIKTDGGWKFAASLEVAYKQPNGDWQIAKLPVIAYNKDESKMWFKGAVTSSQPAILEGEVSHNIVNYQINNQVPFINGLLPGYNNQNIYLGIGSFLRLNTEYPDYGIYSHNDGMLGDEPRYTESDIERFRTEGDPRIFGYQDNDGRYILWPFITGDLSLSKLEYYSP